MDKQRKIKIAWYIAYISLFLFCFLIAGPLLESLVIVPMKPYIIVDKEEYLNAQKCGAASKNCDLPPVLPIEMAGTTPIKTLNLSVDRVPEEYLPYVHYPDNWNSYWNPFQPNGVGPLLKTILNILVPVSGLATIIYGIFIWRKGGFKGFIDRLKL